jgi:hypothetical protein
MSFMLSLIIADKEILYRAVPNNPIMWKFKMNRPSSAVFKDERGVSVDRDGGRNERQVIDDFNGRMPGRGLVSIKAKTCREIGTEPVARPLENNIYHAEIYDSDGGPQIARSKLKKSE